MGSLRDLRSSGRRFPGIANRVKARPYRQAHASGPAQRRPLFGAGSGIFEDEPDSIASIAGFTHAHAIADDARREAVNGAQDGNAEAGRTTIRLGALEVAPAARSIAIGGAAVELGGRAFDLLMVLLDAKGGIVSKEDLFAQVWPTVTVVESNLKVQLSLLRRALGDESWRIKTISGRGYLFVSDDARIATASPPAKSIAPAPAAAKQLVIVVDADVSTQEIIVRALSDAAKYFTGATQLSLVSRDVGTPALAI